MWILILRLNSLDYRIARQRLFARFVMAHDRQWVIKPQPNAR
jgi:hypothetical protein